jgi:hypothetical protein
MKNKSLFVAIITLVAFVQNARCSDLNDKYTLTITFPKSFGSQIVGENEVSFNRNALLHITDALDKLAAEESENEKPVGPSTTEKISIEIVDNKDGEKVYTTEIEPENHIRFFMSIMKIVTNLL